MIQAPIHSIILAAGLSRRFGTSNKLLAPLGDRPILHHVIRKAIACNAGPCLVVTGHQADAISSLATSLGATTVFNPSYAEGLGTSIAAGVSACGDAGGWLIWPGDLPRVRSATIQKVLGERHPERPVVPLFGNQRGHPVLFPASFRAQLEALQGDIGGRHLLEDVISVPVADAGIFRDIDRPSDLLNP